MRRTGLSGVLLAEAEGLGAEAPALDLLAGGVAVAGAVPVSLCATQRPAMGIHSDDPVWDQRLWSAICSTGGARPCAATVGGGVTPGEGVCAAAVWPGELG
jgi:hypothetical protein